MKAKKKVLRKSMFRPAKPGEPACSLTRCVYPPVGLTPDDIVKMGEIENRLVMLNLTAQVSWRVDALLKTGLWGKTRNEVVEQLLCDRLRQPDIQDATNPGIPACL